jgi:hypothetical protein
MPQATAIRLYVNATNISVSELGPLPPWPAREIGGDQRSLQGQLGYPVRCLYTEVEAPPADNTEEKKPNA